MMNRQIKSRIPIAKCFFLDKPAVNLLSGAAMDSNPENIMVKLLEEGTEVYRPVPAVVKQGQNVALLLEPLGYDPEDESLEFKPGEKVHFEYRQISGKRLRVAVRVDL